MFSETEAATTTTASSKPSVSVAMLRFLPTIFFAASIPWVSMGGLVEVFTLWVSMMAAVGSASRPALTRARPVSS